MLSGLIFKEISSKQRRQELIGLHDKLPTAKVGGFCYHQPMVDSPHSYVVAQGAIALAFCCLNLFVFLKVPVMLWLSAWNFSRKTAGLSRLFRPTPSEIFLIRNRNRRFDLFAFQFLFLLRPSQFDELHQFYWQIVVSTVLPR